MKPLVHYTHTHVAPVVGCPAVVVPVDHPSPDVSNVKPVVTSPVVSVGEAGAFETMNTRYRPRHDSLM